MVSEMTVTSDKMKATSVACAFCDDGHSSGEFFYSAT